MPIRCIYVYIARIRVRRLWRLNLDIITEYNETKKQNKTKKTTI